MLTQRLSALARRLRRQAAFRGGVAGLQAGLAAAVLVIGIGKVVTPASLLYMVPIVAGAGFLAGAVVAFSRRVSLRTAAIRADQAAGTDELIATAYETGQGNAFAAEIVRKAEEALASRPASALLPRRPRRIPVAGLALLAVIGALLFVPPMTWVRAVGDDPASLSPQLLRALEKTAREIKRAGDRTDQRELKELGAEIQKLAAAAQLGEMTKKEAMAKIAEIARRADEAKQEQEKKEKALSALKNGPARDLADAIGKGDARAAREAAKETAERLAGGAMSEQEKKDLAESLREAARQSGGELSKSAEGAAQAVEQGDSGGLGDKLSKMSDQMKGAKGKGSKGAQGSKAAGGEPQSGGEQAGADDLDDAGDELADAQKELSGDGQSLADKGGKYCDNCGKKKNQEKAEGG